MLDIEAPVSKESKRDERQKKIFKQWSKKANAGTLKESSPGNKKPKKIDWANTFLCQAEDLSNSRG